VRTSTGSTAAARSLSLQNFSATRDTSTEPGTAAGAAPCFRGRMRTGGKTTSSTATASTTSNARTGKRRSAFGLLAIVGKAGSVVARDEVDCHRHLGRQVTLALEIAVGELRHGPGHDFRILHGRRSKLALGH